MFFYLVSPLSVSVTFLPENAHELRNRLQLLFQNGKKRRKTLVEEIVVVPDKLYEYKCVTQNQQKKIRVIFKLQKKVKTTKAST